MRTIYLILTFVCCIIAKAETFPYRSIASFNISPASESYCMMLDSRNHFTGEQLLTRGTVNATLITPREVFVEAVRYHAVSLILIHNHPGGNPAPSKCDKEITERICQAGEMLGINLLDHIIIGDHRYISFREEGLMGVYPE